MLGTLVLGISASITRFVGAVSTSCLPNQTQAPAVIRASATATASRPGPPPSPQLLTSRPAAAVASGLALRLDANPLLQRRQERELMDDDHSRPTNPRTAYRADSSDDEEDDNENKEKVVALSPMLQRRNTLKGLTRPDPERLERSLGRCKSDYM